MPPELVAQFPVMEEAMAAMGVTVWPMVQWEADDALASAAAVADADKRVGGVVICTPDKDLGQCVRGTRVVQLDRRKGTIFDEEGVTAKFGVPPASIPDYLALVGDSADGYPGIKGIGKVGAARMLNQHGPIESFPPEVLADDRRELALLFKDLATLRSGEQLFASADDLRWEGPAEAFADVAERLGDERLLERSLAAPR
jgi:5'-3' exonuclease